MFARNPVGTAPARRLARLAGVLLCLPLVACASGGQDLASLFERVSPSVVTVRTSSEVVSATNPNVKTSVGGIGSGVLISEDGLVMTAAHCVQTADEVAIEFVDGSIVPATVVASQPMADVALVKLQRPPARAVRPAPLGDSDRVRIGSDVFVIGAPLGMTHTLTVGHLSARRSGQVMEGMIDVELLQTDASINQGNSGGPMFNARGEVIGIVSFIRTKSGGSDGLGFAISSNVARALLIDQRSFWSGLEGIIVTGPFARALNLPPKVEGYLVQRVARNSPAAALGIRPGAIPVEVAGTEIMLGGDIIVEVLGLPMRSDDRGAIMNAVRALETGDQLTVKVLRAGMEFELSTEMTAAMVVETDRGG